MIDFQSGTISLELFHRILREIQHSPNRVDDIIDSVSKNQFKSKKLLIEKLDQLGILNKESNVIIFGCWYGSILIPALATRVKKIIGFDLDDEVIRISKNRFFPDYDNLDFVTGDVFTRRTGKHRDATLIINTSCEHMPPMKDWPWWLELPVDSYFAFQSNNMDWIEGHINCVHSLDEFKTQLPNNFEILCDDVLDDSRGNRYTLIGKISSR